MQKNVDVIETEPNWRLTTVALITGMLNNGVSLPICAQITSAAAVFVNEQGHVDLASELNVFANELIRASEMQDELLLKSGDLLN